jgi:5-hydroxyisourate hydrolase
MHQPPTSNSTSNRLQALSSHLSKPKSNFNSSVKMATRDPITCHVLDTTAGRPAGNISATLSSQNSDVTFTAVTNSDGRIANWKSSSGEASVKSIITQNSQGQNAPGVWKIKFNTGEYFGVGNTFFPEVEVAFFVKAGEHYHVPLLLSPYSYSTYRGS